MNQPQDFYPDLVKAGGLAPCLQSAFHKIKSPLLVRTLNEGLEGHEKEIMSRFPTYARVELGQRFSQVYIAAEERLFLYDFWNRGVMLANASTADIVATARSIHRWTVDEATTTQLRNEFSFVKPEASAADFETGIEVEWAWKGYEKFLPNYLSELADFVEVARQTPEIRQLFPYTSLNRFCFSRCTGYPYSGDCPIVIPKADGNSGTLLRNRYEVCLGNKLLGEGDGAQAVRLVVENLPEDCGPAVAGTADDL